MSNKKEVVEKMNALEKIASMTKEEGKELDGKIPTIEVKKYYKKFKKFVAAKDAEFNVGHGVIHGFIGPNGSGKTTIIKAMIGAYVPTKGEVLINGHKAGSTKANELIGYIPERASFPGHLDSISYLTAMGELSGLKHKEAKKRASEVLNALGLQDHATRKPKTFSSGMQKKILLAQSLLTNPKILILDEPAANLDPTARKELFDQLIELRNQGKTILISSHILAELERLIDEVTFIYYGEVIYSGSVKKLTKGKADVFIKSLDNFKLAEFLKKNKYKVVGDIKTEIVIKSLDRTQTDSLLKAINKSKVSILSFRANDLLSVYDKLITKAEKENRGKQELGKKKTVAMVQKDKSTKKQPKKKGGK